MTAAAIRKVIPKKLDVVEYGRLRRVDGGDRMQARELVSPIADGRDMSFARVSLKIPLCLKYQF
jgi:hypothetical protein